MVCALSGPATFPYFMASAVLAVGRTSFNGVCLANFTNRISVRLTPSTGIQRFSFLASLAFCFIRTPSFDLNRAVGVNPAACGARKSHFSVFPFDVLPRSYAPASGTVARGDFTHDAFIFSVARQDRLSYIASIHFCPPYANASCPCGSMYMIGVGARSPVFKYPQLDSTSAFATIGTTLFPIRATCSDLGYFFHSESRSIM